MNKIKLIFAASAAFLLWVGFDACAQYPSQVRIMTYNINAEAHTNGDYTDIGKVIKEINPTIAGLQKVDSCSVAAKPVDVLSSLAEQTDMVPTFCLSYKKNNGSYGNGFLTDSIPKSSRRLAIPKGSASEDRSALEIGITMGGESVRVIVTHLDYASDANRTAQLRQIVPWIDSGGTASDPVVIMADFNAQYTDNCMKFLTDAGFVFVKGKNGMVLDTSSRQGINHILYRPEARWKVVDAGNPAYAASNRNPVWADMELLNPVDAVVPFVNFTHEKKPEVLLRDNMLRYRPDPRGLATLHIFDLAGRQIIGIKSISMREVVYSNKTAFSCGVYNVLPSTDGGIEAPRRVFVHR